MAIFGNKKTTEDKDEKKEVKKVAEKVADKKTDPSMEDLYAEKTTKKSSTSAKSSKKNTGNAYRVLVKPVVTEKATTLVSEDKYAFIVAKKTNKIEIAKAVNNVYGVDVESVNVINMIGKKVSRGKIKGKRSDFKKAIVTIKKGQSINLYEGV